MEYQCHLFTCYLVGVLKEGVNINPGNESIRGDMQKFQFWWLTGMGSKTHTNFCLKGGGDFKKQNIY